MRRFRQRGLAEGILIYIIIGLGIALAVSWAGAGTAVWYLDGKVDKANDKAAAAAAALGAEKQSREGFQAAAATCTTSVAKLEKRATDAEAAYAKSQGLSKGLTDAVQAHIQAMLNRPRPEGLSECDAMKKELNDEIDYRAGKR